jgi:IMP cyclohydrolase
VLCGGDQDTFFLQAGGVAYLGYIAADRLNFKTVKITAAENNARSRYGRKDP